MKRWLTIACLAAFLTGICTGSPTLRAQTEPTTQPNPTSAAPGASTTLQTLQDPSADPAARELAAVQIVSARAPEDVDPLAQLLQNSADTRGQLAVARALGQVAWPIEPFADPLASLLQAHDPARAGAVAMALAHYQEAENTLLQLRNVVRNSSDDDIRVAVIHAIGTIDTLEAAQVLIELQKSGISNRVVAAAGDALIDLTGLHDLGHDADRWNDWWTQHQHDSEPQFQQNLRQWHADDFAERVQSQTTLQSAAERLLVDHYTRASAADRAGMVTEYLRSASPEIRALGAALVYESRGTTQPPPDSVMAEVRGRLDDDSPAVRAAAARALNNDANSLDKMVARLRVEQDDIVRVELIRSLSPLHDTGVLALMVDLLASPAPPTVRGEAAHTLADGASILALHADLRTRAIQTLRKVFDQSQQPELAPLRAAIVDALADQSDEAQLPFFQKVLLTPDSAEVHIAALHGLGAIKDPNVADSIVAHLDDQGADIRLAAVQALRTVPGATIYFPQLLERMTPDKEPDTFVQDEAWSVLRDWMPQMQDSELDRLSEGLSKISPPKQLIALLAMRDNLKKEVQTAAGADLATLEHAMATVEERIGTLEQTLGQPQDAAGHFRAALDIWTNNGGQPATLQKLCEDVTESLLGAKQWDEAATFASGVISAYHTNPNLWDPEVVSSPFKRTAEKLAASDDPGRFDDASALFAAIDKMNPPLPKNYPEQLAQLRDEIAKQQHSPTTGP